MVFTQGTDPTVSVVAKDGGVEVNEYPVHAIGKELINDTNGAGYVHALREEMMRANQLIAMPLLEASLLASYKASRLRLPSIWDSG